MNNELINMDFENMSDEEFAIARKQMEIAKEKIQQMEMKKLKENFIRYKEETDIRLQEQQINQDRLSEEIEKTKGMAESSLRATSVRYGWVNQGDFGRFFEQSIGSKTVGKLMKIVGLAMGNKSVTTPYRKYIPKYATTSVQRNKQGYDYTKVEWNFELCMDFINEWLKNKGYYESFYSAKNPTEMEKFINQLYTKKE